ncbi:MAG TPA: glycoside hydrolase family 76 protein, partial [Nitrolancea sp.]|nr:glycoside hydrolase family 76 protein [Nitrolancea sp.]
GWQVESGNAGQHYLQWRYGDPVLRQQNLKRATAAYQAMQQQEYQADVALYHELGSRDYAYHWPFSQASAATIDLAGLPDAGGSYLSDLQQRLTGLDHYWDATHQPPGLSSAVMPPLGPSGDLFYDDNAWTGLALVQAYRETGNPDLLERARRILQFDLSGWDNDASHPAPGGVFWVDAGWNRDRNTVSTAGTAKLALQLADVTSDPAQRAGYLAWGQKLTGWVEQTLRAPDGLYWDHIDLAGKIDKTEWSYNQGQMIGAYVLLYRLTGDQNDRQRAQAIANAALAFYVDGGRLDAQPPIFNAIFFENLQFLATVDANPRYTWEAQRYADWLWTTRRDPATNLFAGASEPGSSANDALLDQAAVIQLYARLAWDPGSYGLSR